MSRGYVWACRGCNTPLGYETVRAFKPARRVQPIPLKPTGAMIVCPWCGTKLEWQPRQAS